MVDNDLVGWLDDAVASGAEPSTAANWITGELLGACASDSTDVHASGLSGIWIGQLVGLVADGTLSNKLAKQVLNVGLKDGGTRSPSAVAEAEGLQQVSDEGALQLIIDQVIARNAKTVEDIRGGNPKAIGALVGQVMGATKGQADPKLTNRLLQQAING
ncbi:MAG: aspartyl-tRNA(Asn)/glutamyl-tRNA(Gln) amidotransferase subunit B [Nitriliruptoraceae bacterium]